MRAAAMTAFGGPEVLEHMDVAGPEELADDMVLVDVEATSVNYFDVELRQGLMDLPLPHVLGLDVVGRVASASRSSGVVEGQRVLALPISGCGRCDACRTGRENLCNDIEFLGLSRPGGYGAQVAIPSRTLLPLEGDELSIEEAAAFPVVYTTAWHLLTRILEVKPAESVLVMNATGGLGLACIQLASLLGARVAAVTRDAQKADVLHAHGADVVLIRDDTLPEAVRESLDGGPAVMIDNTGGTAFAEHTKFVRRGGRIGFVGSITGDVVPNINLRQLYFNGIALRGATLGGYVDLQKVLTVSLLHDIRPVLDSSYHIADSSKAHERMASSDRSGKIILTHEH